MFPKPISWLDMEKLNHTFTNQNKCSTAQNKHKKLKPGLVASCDIRTGNRGPILILALLKFVTFALT